ncbi:C-C motif chemokine 4 homolog [Cynoglossus semilaevis]|uniref:C-C motif chemokine n=1 Tax=Cynoglossus semilaevis TaxID=244447 RepID=A0A3P8WTW9_CYNSE|nr:C-C motif chemokine 4 homolog [Cynoglossus semilaevis]
MKMMGMMTTPVVLVTCISLLSSMAVLASQSNFGPDKCCFTFISQPLPVKRVMSFRETNRQCPKAGVLFTMKSERKICADPSLDWVKKIMQVKEKSIPPPSSPAKK